MEAIFLYPVTFLIIIVTVLVSILGFRDPSFLDKSILHPYSVFRGRQIHTMITSGFIHADYPHLLFNMLSFFYFGPLVESFFTGYFSVILGRTLFLIVYLISLIISDLPTVFQQKDNSAYASLGASGAVCAILYMGIMIAPEMNLGLMFIPIPIPAPLYGFLYIALSVYLSKRGEGNINHLAHLSGAIFGIIIMLILAPFLLQNFINYLINL